MLPEENILFSGIDVYDCHRMLQCFKTDCRKYRAGEKVSDFSGFSDKIGIVLNGSAVIVKYDYNGNRTIIEHLGEQGIFGKYFAYTSFSENDMEVICDTDCEIMYVRYSEITKRCESACRCHSQVVENLLALMSKKMISLSERIEVLTQRTIVENLISCLRIIEEKTPDGDTPQLQFTITELADYLCVNRSALQREIAKLRSRGVLRIDKRKFWLRLN